MNVQRLNINVAGRPVPGYLGSDDALREVGLAAGGELPASYVTFLRYADGGHPEIGSFSLPDGSRDDLFDVDWFYGIAGPGVQKLTDALASWRSELGIGALPIARDGGGNQIFLRLNPPDLGVWLYVHDAEQKVHRVANTFEQFIEALRENPDFI